MEAVWERTGTFKIMAGDWMNHLSITILPCKAAGFAMYVDWSMPPVVQTQLEA